MSSGDGSVVTAPNSTNAVFTTKSALVWIAIAGVLSLIIGGILGFLAMQGSLTPVKATFVFLGTPGVFFLFLGGAVLVVDTVLPGPTLMTQAGFVLANSQARLAVLDTQRGAAATNSAAVGTARSAVLAQITALANSVAAGTITSGTLGAQKAQIDVALNAYGAAITLADSNAAPAPADDQGQDLAPAVVANSVTPPSADGAIAAGLAIATKLADTTRELSSARTLLTWGTALVGTAVLVGLVMSGAIVINPGAIG